MKEDVDSDLEQFTIIHSQHSVLLTTRMYRFNYYFCLLFYWSGRMHLQLLVLD